MYCRLNAIVTSKVLLRKTRIGAVNVYPNNARVVLLTTSKKKPVTGRTAHAKATVSINRDEREWNRRGACAILPISNTSVENETVQKYVTLARSECFNGEMKTENHRNSNP